LELKSASIDEDIELKANEALSQIKQKRYAAEFPDKFIVGIGLGLRKKECAVTVEKLN
jgi:hypoxanthine-guanine phosphoribosyltransferase